MRNALASWSTCMRSKGYRIGSPLDAPSLAPSANGPHANAQEISVAVADVACKSATGLIRTWFTVESAIQHQEVEDNQLALGAVQQRLTAAVKAAAAVNAG